VNSAADAVLVFDVGFWENDVYESATEDNEFQQISRAIPSRAVFSSRSLKAVDSTILLTWKRLIALSYIVNKKIQ
jgi:hypothetical protein